MVDAVLILCGLVVWGGHVTAPWRLAGRSSQAQQRWRLAALPLLIAAALAFLTHLTLYPDRAIAGGLATLPRGNGFSRLLTVLFLATLAIDLLVLFAGQRLGKIGWRLASAGALPLLLSFGLAGEVLRIGQGPLGEPLLVWPAVLARSVIALAAGDLWVRRPPIWSPAAALAVPLYFLSLPNPLRVVLWQVGLGATMAASILLLLSARWLPQRYRRLALTAGLFFCAILLAQAATFSEALSGAMR